MSKRKKGRKMSRVRESQQLQRHSAVEVAETAIEKYDGEAGIRSSQTPSASISFYLLP
jgi:hypothetical protein